MHQKNKKEQLLTDLSIKSNYEFKIMDKLLVGISKFLKEGPIGIYLMAFLIPLNPRMLGFAVAIIIVEQLIRSPKIDKTHFKSQLSWRNPGVWLLLFYLMHFVGLINTENMGFAKMDLGMKASLGIFPVFFMLYKVKVNWKLFVKAFIVGAFMSILINAGFSMVIYNEKRHTYYITGERLSHMMHRGYWATYLVLTYFLLLKQMIASKSKKSFLLNLLGALLMIIFIMASGAKVGFIILFFVSVWGVFSLFNRFRNKWILPSAFVVIALTITSVYYFIPSISHRVTEALSVFTEPIESFDKVKPESTTARIMLWDSSRELIMENFWWGVGTGDVKDELIKRNYEKGYIGVAEQKLNSHFQFLNSHIAIGVFGSLFLLLSVIMNYLKQKPDEFRAWRIGIITILFIAMLPESMLETQAGIIPYAFLFTFLPSFKPKQ